MNLMNPKMYSKKNTMKNLKLLLVLILSIVGEGIVTSVEAVNCNDKDGLKNLNEGTLDITNAGDSNGSCVFEPNSWAFLIKTDELTLQHGEDLEISHLDGGKTVTVSYKPPFDTGYLLINVPNVTLTFHLKPHSSYSVYFKKFVDKDSISWKLNCDVNNHLKIRPYTYQEFDLKLWLTKTLPLVHLEVVGSRLKSSSTGHALYGKKTTEDDLQTVVISSNDTTIIQTSEAMNDCSEIYDDTAANLSISMQLKITNNYTGPYQCVWLFEANKESHYDIDFKNFISLIDARDELSIIDAAMTLRITEDQAVEYVKRIISSSREQLAIIYTSPVPTGVNEVHSNLDLFQLDVSEKNTGGLIQVKETPQPLTFKIPSTRYTILPQSHQFAAIQLLNVKGMSELNIFDGNQLIAKFGANSKLPPKIAMNEANKPMTVEVITSTNIEKAISAMSLKESSHKISTKASDVLSLLGPQDSVWTITPSSVLLSFQNFDLKPSGCLTIQSFDQDKPFFTRCNVTGPMPPFALNGAYVYTNLPKADTRVDASISPWIHETIKKIDKPNSPTNITSTGYPTSYALSASQDVITFNYTGSSYILSVADIDLRKGEKLSNEKNETLVQYQELALVDDGKSTPIKNLTLYRPQVQDDYSSRRGYRLLLTKFGKIITADQTNKSVVIPQNLTSVYIKISFPGDKGKFGNRIKFNSSNSEFMKIYDSGSLLSSGPTVQNNTSTSSTIIIVYQLTTNSTYKVLPNITLTYELVPCQDHICDNYSRCVPNELLCKGKKYCQDGSDIKRSCSSGPAPVPEIIEKGVSGFTVFILSVLMLIIGAVTALYGPDLYTTLEARFRNGQYTSFTSTE